MNLFKLTLFSIILSSFSINAAAQNCNNWLSTPALNSTVNIGDLDVAGDQLTVEATINRTLLYILGTTDNSDGDVVSKHNTPADVNYLLRPNNASITTSNGFFITPDICPLLINKTYHIAMVYDGSTLKFYRNGFLMSQVNATGNLFQNNWNTRFGLYDPSFWKTQFIGYINEVRIWNVARTQVQLNNYINTSLPSPITQIGLLGYYTFDNLLNKQGNVTFNGTLTGAATINQTNLNCAFALDSCAKIISLPQDNLGGIINTYTSVIGLKPCLNSIEVKNATTFNIGDTVLLIQMKGAVIDSSNSTSFGTITDYRNAGNYEFNYVKSKIGNLIEFKNILTKNYDIENGKVQLIRVPYFNNAKITFTLTCLPWDGEKGGVLVLNAKESVNLNANIDVSGKGFYGAKVNNPKSNSYYCHENEYYYPNDPIKAAPRGEAITEISLLKSFGKGAVANGGGGGLEHNSGGGGGSNFGIGGSGGNEWNACSPPSVNGGLGGKSLNYSTTLNKIFLGGGGGGGHCDNIPGFNPDGGNGGGIVMVQTNSFIANTFSIIANGAGAIECFRDGQAYKCHEGMGGGGGGGSILLQANTYLDNLTLEIKGGKGADMNGEIAGKLGPGGGGGGGVTWFSNGIIPVNVIVKKNGGINGVNIDFGNDNFGATTGQDGSTLFDLNIPIDTVLFKKNIDSTRIKFNISTCNTVNFNGFAFINKNPIVQWLWDFGDKSIATTQNNTHIFSVAGTYNIILNATDNKGCTDSATAIITTTGSEPADFSYKQDVCNPLSIQFFALGATPINPKWFYGDSNTSNGVVNPTYLYAAPGTYTVKYVTQNLSCTDTISKNITVNFTKDNIILTHDTTICFGSTKQLLTTPALLDFCWTPTTNLSDANSANPTTNTTVPITYYFTATVPGNNLIINGDFSGGNTGFTSQYINATPNTTEGQYFVGTNVKTWNALMSNCADHTTGTGKMLLVNGAPVPDVGVWNQTVAVTPNTNYAFSTWIQSLYPPNPAQLSFSINGSDIGTPITASFTNCVWTQFYTTWNSGNNTKASIAIVNKNIFVQGNDFALDDISFSAVTIKRDSVIIKIETPIVKSGRDTTTCAGEPVQLQTSGAATYNWTPATALSNAGINNPIASPVNTTQYIVTGITANGCSATDTVIISTNPLPIIQRTSDTLICNNVTAQLWATGGSSYKWWPANTLSNPSIFNPVASPNNNTLYYLLVTGANSCTAKDSVKITLRPAIVFAVSPPDTTCTNKAVQLSASGGDSYLWSPAAMVTDAGIANPLSKTNADVAYTVLIKENTCNTSKLLNTSLKVFPVPVITTSKSNDVSCTINSAILNASGATIYTWSPAETLSNNNISNPVAAPQTTTNYTVSGTDLVTKCTATGSITVMVTKDGEPKFFIPKGFSPNGDGLNDCFKVTHFNYLKSVEISIYNRFGYLVFHTTSDNNCWDGTVKGNPSEPGNYVYYIKTENNCASFIKKGNLVLLR